MFDLRKWENIHIPLWLLKDTCWVMEWRYLGAIMILPTVLVAIYILIKSIGSVEFLINLAIVFWISANSFWMAAEFFGFGDYKGFAVIPFSLGLLSVSVYYVRSITQKKWSWIKIRVRQPTQIFNPFRVVKQNWFNAIHIKSLRDFFKKTVLKVWRTLIWI